jgi:acetyl esterase/lipase
MDAMPRAASTASVAAPLYRDFAASTIEPTLVLPLWPEAMPGLPAPPITEFIDEQILENGLRKRVAHRVTCPTLSYFAPRDPTGAAVLLIPGGGYQRVGIDHEGYEYARWMASLGVAGFVLKYRLPVDRWGAGPDVALQDAQRAIRLIRQGGRDRWAIDPERVTVFGASAGGHLAGSLAIRSGDRVYPSGDAADRLPARPDGLVLLYPVISMLEHAHAGSREALFGDAPTAAQLAAHSLERNVPANMPPVLLIHAAQDREVAVEQSVLMYRAVRAAGGIADMHLFEEGDHGVGLRADPSLPIADWPGLARRWQVRHGLA